jgi:GTP-binding protein
MIPKVAIIGRPNVGKSSLLNMLANRRISIVDPTAGVTRDRVSTIVTLPNTSKEIELIDTGGYGIEDSMNLTAEVERQIANAIGESQLLLFVVDAQSGITPLDTRVAELLRPYTAGKTQILLVANKVDSERLESEAFEMMKLGFGEPIAISATTKHNVHDLIGAIVKRIDWDLAAQDASSRDAGVLLAIVGKRNAGKSTLVNALAGSERVIVSEQEGTTRDSVDVRFEIEDHVFTAIDTAGVRRRKSIKQDIEYYSNHRALRSIRRADVVILVLDATVSVSQVDHQLVGEILKHDKPTVVVVNKWDLVEEDSSHEEFMTYFDDSLKGMNFAPFVFISAKDQEGVRDVLGMALNLYQQAGHRVTTGELNRVLEQVLTEKPPTSKSGRRPKVYFVTQLDVHPPTIVMSVNNPAYFDNTYQRFLLNRFRDLLPYAEVPIKLLIRHHQKGASQESGLGES